MKVFCFLKPYGEVNCSWFILKLMLQWLCRMECDIDFYKHFAWLKKVSGFAFANAIVHSLFALVSPSLSVQASTLHLKFTLIH